MFWVRATAGSGSRTSKQIAVHARQRRTPRPLTFAMRRVAGEDCLERIRRMRARSRHNPTDAGCRRVIPAERTFIALIGSTFENPAQKREHPHRRVALAFAQFRASAPLHRLDWFRRPAIVSWHRSA